MKRISFSGTFTVSDKVFEYLQSAEYLAGVDQVGMYRTNDTFLYFIHDALEDWVRMNQRGLIEDSQNLCETLAETNKLLALLVGSRGVPTVPVVPQSAPQVALDPVPELKVLESKQTIDQPKVQQSQPVEPDSTQQSVEQPEVSDPEKNQVVKLGKQIDTSELEKSQSIKPVQPQLSPDEIRARLTGFIRK